MSVDEGVTRWLRELEAGDQDAARLLWQRYYRELVELARARLGQTPLRMADEEDVALSVLRCLYEGAARGQFVAVVNRQELWQLLATITIRKVIDHQRLLKKRNRGRCRDAGSAGDRGGRIPAFDARARRRSPAQHCPVQARRPSE